MSQSTSSRHCAIYAVELRHPLENVSFGDFDKVEALEVTVEICRFLPQMEAALNLHPGEPEYCTAAKTTAFAP